MPSNRRPQVAIIGSSEAGGALLQLAEQAGASVARAGAALVTGGRGGIMLAASRGCAAAGGTVIGVTPHVAMDEVNEYAHYHIPTGMGWARNAITGIAGDVVLAIGGSAGTLSELAFAWMYERPIIALSRSGGWAARLAGSRIDERRGDAIIDCQTIEQLDAALAVALRPWLLPCGAEARTEVAL